MNKNVEELSEVEIMERYIILLLGVMDKSIPSLLHLEKELFILSRASPNVSRFITFMKHYYGPYSDDVRELVKNPVYYSGAYEYDGKRVNLTPEGREIYNNLIEEYSDNPRFNELIGILKMTRELYEKLSTEELLFLIYITYPEYREKSRVSEQLLSRDKKKELAQKLLRKGIITEDRYLEVLEDA